MSKDGVLSAQPPAGAQQRARAISRPSPVLRAFFITALLSAAVFISAMVSFPGRLPLASCLLAWISGYAHGHVLPSHGSLPASSSIAGYGDSTRLAAGHYGAVSSESDVCSTIGKNLLLQGGNAADALVGTTFCVGVIGMYHSGIGGGGFMVVRGADGEYEYIDFRETAPAAAFQDMYINDTDASIYGGLASGVPGEVAGLWHLHSNYGALSWKSVMQGAIKVAREGFPVSADLVRYMGAATAGQPTNFLVDDPNWAIDFAPNGTLLKLNETITRKRLADTLETIAEYGPDAFYKGPLAEDMINAIQEANGTMTLEDLANYTVAIREPAKIDYRGYKIHSCSAPASGTVALSAMKIIEGYDMDGIDGLNLSTHRFDEAIRFAYGQRTNLGDPSFVPGIPEYEADMLNATTISHIHSLISDQHTLNVSAYNPSGLEVIDTPGTSHVVAADHSGLAITLTTTINLLFGSHVLVPESGIILNNEMNDFSIPGTKNAFGFPPSPANYIRAGKRPLSSIAGSIVEFPNGTLHFVTGAAGGSRIITATLQTLWNVLDRGMDAYEALAEPRLHDQLQPNTVAFEWSYDNGTVEYMRGLGHDVAWVGPGQSSAQCLRVSGEGRFDAASEPRQVASGAYVV